MNESFEVLPFGAAGEMEGEMERSRMRVPRAGAGMGAGARMARQRQGHFGAHPGLRGGGRTPGAAFNAASGASAGGNWPRQQHVVPPGGHVPFRARHGRRRHFPPPWPNYYGPYYGPGWATYGGPATINVFDDGSGDGDGGFDVSAGNGGFDAGASGDFDAGVGYGGPPGGAQGGSQGQAQGELAGGCNCPKCRQQAMSFEVLPFG